MCSPLRLPRLLPTLRLHVQPRPATNRASPTRCAAGTMSLRLLRTTPLARARADRSVSSVSLICAVCTSGCRALVFAFARPQSPAGLSSSCCRAPRRPWSVQHPTMPPIAALDVLARATLLRRADEGDGDDGPSALLGASRPAETLLTGSVWLGFIRCASLSRCPRPD